MSPLAVRLRDRYYPNDAHPYRIFERRIESLLRPATRVMLDAGCGRTAPVLRKYVGRVERLIGVERVPFEGVPVEIETYSADLAELPFSDESVDLIVSRSVFEHLTDPDAVYHEMERVLRPGGHVVFLTANMWDYGTFVARLVPNRLHSKVVKAVEGRKEEDTFPTAYKTNSRTEVERLAAAAHLRITSFQYLNQYPNYLMFNAFLFLLGMCYERVTSRFEFLRFLRGWILVTLEKPMGEVVGGN